MRDQQPGVRKHVPQRFVDRPDVRRKGLLGLVALFFVVAVATGGSAVSPRSVAASASASTSSSLTVNRPGSVAVGDILVAAVSARVGEGAAINAPSGWSLVRRDSCSGPGGVVMSQPVYTRVVSASEPASYTWTFGAPTGAAAVIVDYAGVSTSSPVEAHGGITTRNSQWVRNTSITTASPNALVVAIYGRSDRGSFSAPSGLIGKAGLATSGSAPADGIVVADMTQVTPGSTGDRPTKTGTIAACDTGQMLALRPASGTSPAPPAPSPAPSPAPPPPSHTPSVVAPSVTASPVVTGSTLIGGSLSTTTGSWSGTAPMTYRYQWSRCAAGGSACGAISGATSQRYTLGSADVGRVLRSTVTAANTAGAATAASMPSALVVDPTPEPSPAPPPPSPPPPAPAPPPPPAPSPPPPPAPSPPPPPSSSAGTVIRNGSSWECNGPVNLDLVKVSGASGDAIVLAEGCTGRIGRIEVDTWTQDGVKIQNQSNPAHDLTIGGGYVICHDITPGAHQDAVQAMGGARITFTGVTFDCLGNSNFFVNEAGSGATTPTDIVCDGCTFGGKSSTTVRVNVSVRSGVRNSSGCAGRNVKEPFYFTDAAQSPVNSGNRELASSDSLCS